MLRVTVRATGLPTVTIGSGDTLAFGRQPADRPSADPNAQLRRHLVSVPQCAPYVSRLVGELVVSPDVVRLRWRGTTEGTLSSLFDAPGGARRVTLAKGMTALLDDGENHIVVLRGRLLAPDDYADLLLSVMVEEATVVASTRPSREQIDRDGVATAPAPAFEPRSREWFVALALAEPWLSGADDYPRPPSNREIYERVLGWHGYAWNLSQPQRVDDALRAIARVAFGPADDPFVAGPGRAQNVRFAIGRRAAEVRLVTADDLGQVEREARARRR